MTKLSPAKRQGPGTDAACTRCLLPAAMPGIDIDASGLCRFCRASPPAEVIQAERAALRAGIDAVIAARRGADPYDVIVAFSGGKDSSYTLKLLVEDYGLKCLAITIDNGFLGGDTVKNCQSVCAALGVDHTLFTPNRGFVDTMYRKSALDESLHSAAAIKRASSICSSCIAMINTHMLKQAFLYGTPIIAGGYIGGQVPKDGAVMHVQPGRQARIRSKMVNRFVDALGEKARSYFEIDSAVAGSSLTEIDVINPMLGLTITEAEIIAEIETLGWVRPVDTGITSTNCRLNDLGVFIHSKRHGFHPYALEIAEQLRAGTMERAEAQAKLARLPERKDVKGLAEKVGLAPDEY
ncbi:MAG: hypothetical protein AAF841_01655 [Pseudomonadota bacterium]